MAAVMLASSRCIDTVSSKWGTRLFDGNKTWLWCLVPTTYGLYFGYFGKPVLFTGIYACWFFNPYPGYFDDTELIYDNPQHTVHNFLTAILFVGVYSVFILLFTIKNFKYKGVVKQSKQQRIVSS
ncbi:Protein SRT-41 [Aphelenchoides avenae]|nr:Protein SRT-41 [Aphelenchus avenae]